MRYPTAKTFLIPPIKWAIRHSQVTAAAIALVFALGFWCALGNGYTPFKDEFKYRANAQKLLQGQPLDHPAFSPFHALPATGLEALGVDFITAARIVNVLWLVAACCLMVWICRQLKLGRVVGLLAVFLCCLLTNVLVAGTGMLAEPMAGAAFLAGWSLLLLSRDRPLLGGVLAGVAFGIAALVRIEMVGIGLAALILWAVAGIRRNSLPVLFGLPIFAVLALTPSLTQYLAGGEFSFFRSHPTAGVRSLDLAGGHGSSLAKMIGTYFVSVMHFVVPDLSRVFPYALRAFAIIGILTLVVRKHRSAIPIALMLVAASAVLAIFDSSITLFRRDELVGRNYYAIMLAMVIPAAYACRRVFSSTRYRWVLFSVLALQLFLFLGWYLKAPSRFWPRELWLMAEQFEKLEIGDEQVIAERMQVAYYINAQVVHYRKLPDQALIEDVARLCDQQGIKYVIAQERWSRGRGQDRWIEPALKGVHQGFMRVGGSNEIKGGAFIILRRDPPFGGRPP